MPNADDYRARGDELDDEDVVTRYPARLVESPDGDLWAVHGDYGAPI